MAGSLTHHCVLSVSSTRRITSVHLLQILQSLSDEYYVVDCRFEAPTLGLCNNSVESMTKLHIIDNLTAEEVREAWTRIVDACPDLELHCAWCEWGGYQGCVLEVGNE